MKTTIKDVPSKIFLASTHETTIPEIAGLAGKVTPQLFEVAKQNDLRIAGPMEFHYDGVDGNPQTVFKLVVALPIASKPSLPTPPPVEVLETKPFHCIALDYVGSIPEITAGYMALFAEMKDRNLTHTSECREVYKHWVDFDSKDNLTEIQYGIG